MLLQIRDFIKQQGVVSSQQIARVFKIDVDALKPMLEIWERKGVIRSCHPKNPCQSSCFRCDMTPSVYYEPA